AVVFVIRCRLRFRSVPRFAFARFSQKLWKTLWKSGSVYYVVTRIANVLANCTTAGRSRSPRDSSAIKTSGLYCSDGGRFDALTACDACWNPCALGVERRHLRTRSRSRRRPARSRRAYAPRGRKACEPGESYAGFDRGGQE